MNHPGESGLADLRMRIDEIDVDLVRLLAQRFVCIDQVVEIKRRDGLPARNARIEDVVQRVRLQAEHAGLSPEFVEHVWRAMIEWVIGYEQQRLSPAADTGSSRYP